MLSDEHLNDFFYCCVVQMHLKCKQADIQGCCLTDVSLQLSVGIVHLCFT